MGKRGELLCWMIQKDNTVNANIQSETEEQTKIYISQAVKSKITQKSECNRDRGTQGGSGEGYFYAETETSLETSVVPEVATAAKDMTGTLLTLLTTGSC